MGSSTVKGARSGLPLHRAVLLAVCLIGAAILGLDGWRTWQSRVATVRDDKVETANLARSLAQHAHDAIQMADTVLVGLRERVERDGTEPANLDRVRAVMALRVASLPIIHGLFLYDSNGEWLANSALDAPGSLNNQDRAYFQYHRRHTDRGVHIGEPVRSRSDDSWIITVSRRIDTPTGAFGGVVLATLSVSSLTDYYASFDVGPHGVITLASPNGIVIARMPHDPKLIGADISAGALFQEVRRHPQSGSFSFSSSLDAVERLGSYRRVDDYDLTVIVAHGIDDVLEDWREDARLHVALSGSAALAICVLGAYFANAIRQRQETELRYRLLADNSSDAIICMGKDGRKLYVSPSFTTLTGWSVAECMAVAWGALAYPEDRPRVLAAQAELENGATRVTTCYRFMCRDGSTIWVEAGLQYVDPVSEGQALFVASIRDISKRKAAEDQVQALNLELIRQAHTDALTGLGNRRSFEAEFGQAWRRTHREASDLSIVMIDVDRFKLFNDRYGHPAGDACLHAVAGAVMQCMRRPCDFAGRYGGEEIVVLLPDTPAAGARLIADTIRAAIEALGIPHEDNPPTRVVTASLGVATMSPRHYPGPDGCAALLHRADTALYEAKQGGRNRVATATMAPAGL
jgi:diguanylate cyclase (GGDEF)-like protein/PAS domain S-box-containing protein